MGPDNRTPAVPVVGESKDAYYKDASECSFSALKVFSKCQQLYKEIFVEKTYVEPDHDYFVYGKLVDALLTESAQFLAANFIKVERKVKPEMALSIENKIKDLQKEIAAKELEGKAKFDAKKREIQDKIDEIDSARAAGDAITPAVDKKYLGYKTKLAEVEPDKTIAKGIESRKEEIAELQSQLDVIKQLADKQQVTNSIWENADSTALAIRTHPYFSNMEFNSITSQQIFRCRMENIPCKGKLDHILLSPAITKVYAIYKANQMTLEEMQAKIRELDPVNLWAIITDIKTTKSIREIEPYNNHYRGQLGFYQDLVSTVLLIPKQNIRCQILAGDKQSSEFKMSEFFVYTQAALDELKPDVLSWMRIWYGAQRSGKYISSKEIHGMNQKCYTCSNCRFCPLSPKAGEPVLVDKPRFDKGAFPAPLVIDISTADAVLEY